MNKKISMQTRPKPTAQPGADAWVETQSTEPVTLTKTKPVRLTFDLDRDLHSELRIQCAQRGIRIADLMRALIRTELHRPG